MMRATVTSALLAASTVSDRCLSSLVPLALSAVNFDLDDPTWNTTYPVAGVFTVELEYCAPTNAVAAHADTLLLSLPGGTYGPLYWDFPLQPETYSFVRHANARGFATLNVARIGSGRSDHPDPIKILQTPLQIAAALELIASARAGMWGGRRYDKIVGLGHSLSSYILNGAIVQDPAALDGVVLTGFAHTIAGQPDVSAFPQANSLNIPRFAALPSGYVTTPPGARSGGLYGRPGTFDDAVVAFDDAHRDLVSIGEFQTHPVAGGQPAPGFEGHVFVADGADDVIVCVQPRCENLEGEGEAWPAAASFESAVVPDSGHDLNLHLGAPQFFDMVLSWLERHGF